MTASSVTTPTDFDNLNSEESTQDGERLALLEAQERRWISASKKGDLSAFEKLMALHEDRVFRLCFRLLTCREDALEASQDTFVRAHRALPKYQAKGRFSTWLFQIAVNRCRDGWKRTSSRLASLSDAFHLSHREFVCPQPEPGDHAETRDDLFMLERGLRTLPTKHREILMLACVENLPHAECATILKCSERAIEGRLYRARKLLQNWWQRQEADPHF